MMRLFPARLLPRSRRSKKVLFWVTTFLLCALVMTFNDVTLKLTRASRGEVVIPSDGEYIVDAINNRSPMSVKKREKEDVIDEFIQSPIDPNSDLLPDLAPGTLHYIWCGQRYFEFRHYLALKSAVRVIKPDKVFFHYDQLPLTDADGYQQWFNQSVTDTSHLKLHKLNGTGCHHKGTGRFLMIAELLYQYGGIYVPEDAILVDFPVHLRSLPFVSGAYPRSNNEILEGLVIGKKHNFNRPTTVDELLILMSRKQEEGTGLNPCASESAYNLDYKGEIICVTLDRQIYPKDIWTSNHRFATLARVVMYNSPKIEELKDKRSLIPRIAHYVALEDPFVKFTGYLSMLSSVYVAGFQKVFIHGPMPPRGVWWEKLSSDHRFVYVYREFPETEEGNEMSIPRAICITRVDILLKYGGAYVDQNVLWTQEVPTDLLMYDAVASPDWHMLGLWPDSVNHGALMAKRNSQYLQQLHSLFHRATEKEYWFIDHYMSYRIIELNPSLIHLNRHLQVKCLNHNCHPTWFENYRSTLLQNRPGPSFEWQNETLSLHWTDNFPELDPDMVKYTSGMVIDASRFILKEAGVSVMELKK